MAIINIEEGAIQLSGVIFIGKEDRWRFRVKPYRLYVEREGEDGGMYEFDYATRSMRDSMYQRIVAAMQVR